MKERMNEDLTVVLRESWHFAETIDEDEKYKKLKYRKVEQISFYIRPIREWFIPCSHCQNELKKQLANATWILGNKDYEPMIELNSVKNEIDDESWVTLIEHKATKEELERIGAGGWEELKE